MKAVRNIQRITDTMRMIATARFQKMQQRATSAQAYSQKIAEVVGELASSGSGSEGITHPLLAPPPPTGRQLLLVVGSNRGLCGAYNANVLRKATRFLREQRDTQVDLEVVGKKALAFFRFTGREVAAHHSEIGDAPGYADVEPLAERYIKAFADGQYDAVRVVYMAFASVSRQTPQVLGLLPVDRPVPQVTASGSPGPLSAQSSTVYEFSPDAVELLGELLPIAVKTQLFQCFNEAVVSEQLARMVAMKAATDAAGKMGKQLGRKFNRARQAAITTELSEIIGGATAIQ